MPHPAGDVDEDARKKKEPGPKDRPRVRQEVRFLDDPNRAKDSHQGSDKNANSAIVDLHGFHQISEEPVIWRGRRIARATDFRHARFLNLISSGPKICRHARHRGKEAEIDQARHPAERKENIPQSEIFRRELVQHEGKNKQIPAGADGRKNE